MDVWVLVMLFLAMTGYSEGANFCICRGDVSQDALQKALDYACGAGAGADCSSIHDGGGCFQPNTVRAHCSYAANSYYQKKGQAQGSCEFNGAATVTTTDPSSNGCTYPSSGGEKSGRLAGKRSFMSLWSISILLEYRIMQAIQREEELLSGTRIKASV